MPISLDEARTLIDDAIAGKGDTSPGWDARLTAAILVVFGDGIAKVGRERLVQLANDRLRTEPHERDYPES